MGVNNLNNPQKYVQDNHFLTKSCRCINQTKEIIEQKMPGRGQAYYK